MLAEARNTDLTDITARIFTLKHFTVLQTVLLWLCVLACCSLPVTESVASQPWGCQWGCSPTELQPHWDLTVCSLPTGGGVWGGWQGDILYGGISWLSRLLAVRFWYSFTKHDEQPGISWEKYMKFQHFLCIVFTLGMGNDRHWWAGRHCEDRQLRWTTRLWLDGYSMYQQPGLIFLFYSHLQWFVVTFLCS